MAVYRGGTEIGSVYIGSTKADAVYIGETKVWPTLPPWWPDEWEYINSTGNFESVEQARAAADRRGIDYETVTTLDFGFDLSGSSDAAGLVGLWAGRSEERRVGKVWWRGRQQRWRRAGKENGEALAAC